MVGSLEQVSAEQHPVPSQNSIRSRNLGRYCKGAERSRGIVESGEDPIADDEAVVALCVRKSSDDLIRVVDAERLRGPCRCRGVIEGGERVNGHDTASS
jgi:hypothetical protein